MAVESGVLTGESDISTVSPVERAHLQGLAARQRFAAGGQRVEHALEQLPWPGWATPGSAPTLALALGVTNSALDVDGGVPISLLFSGSVFYAAGDGCLRVARIPWSAETVFELPVAAWRDLIETYYPNTAWLTLCRDTFDRLYAFRTAHGLPTWEETLEELLRAAAREAPR